MLINRNVNPAILVVLARGRVAHRRHDGDIAAAKTYGRQYRTRRKCRLVSVLRRVCNKSLIRCSEAENEANCLTLCVFGF